MRYFMTNDILILVSVFAYKGDHLLNVYRSSMTCTLEHASIWEDWLDA